MQVRCKPSLSAVGGIFGIYLMAMTSCAIGNEPVLGGDGGDDGQWGTGGSNTSGMGGAPGSSSSSASSSGSGCNGPELCNGLDDNCNGLIDDEVAAVGNPCSTGLVGVCGVGAVDCQEGKPLCVETNSPMPEVCDNLDNDCNGTVDDGNPGGGDPCTTGLPGVCAEGVLTCMAGAFACAQKTQPMPEVCGDMLDNDCNGAVDNNCGGMGGPCAHDPCVPGGPLAKDCAPCVTTICNIDAFCCTSMWDLTCYTKALDMCPGC